jgi:hypothetical protein
MPARLPEILGKNVPIDSGCAAGATFVRWRVRRTCDQVLGLIAESRISNLQLARTAAARNFQPNVLGRRE